MLLEKAWQNGMPTIRWASDFVTLVPRESNPSIINIVERRCLYEAPAILPCFF